MFLSTELARARACAGAGASASASTCACARGQTRLAHAPDKVAAEDEVVAGARRRVGVGAWGRSVVGAATSARSLCPGLGAGAGAARARARAATLAVVNERQREAHGHGALALLGELAVHEKAHGGRRQRRERRRRRGADAAARLRSRCVRAQPRLERRRHGLGSGGAVDNEGEVVPLRAEGAGWGVGGIGGFVNSGVACLRARRICARTRERANARARERVRTRMRSSVERIPHRHPSGGLTSPNATAPAALVT